MKGKNSMTKMILVRHCQAQGNLERFFQGRIDTDITPLGEKQIEQTALLLKDEPIDIFYCSSKKRARKTAEGINRLHNKELVIDDGIVEINAGKWEGVPLSQVEKIYPEQFYNWKNNPAAFHAPEGESMKDVYDRVSTAIMNIVRNNAGKTICVVSHGCAIMNMMCFLHGLPVERIKEVKLGPNMSVSIVEFDDEFRPAILSENYTEHLGGLSTKEPLA